MPLFPAPECETPTTEAPAEAPNHPAMLGFWPLNEQYGGKNLATEGVDFELGNVGFDTGNGDFRSAPAKFSKTQDSVANLAGASSMVLGRSFSWIGAVYLRSAGDFALFEWDKNPGVGPHIWVYRGKLYINLYCKSAFHAAAVPVGEWVTLAVTFDGQKISFYQNGVRTDVAAPTCGNTISGYNFIRINQR
jgi:hypothetical protein